MPGPSEDVPRWQPPSGPSEDVPRWEPPPQSREVPRWQPAAAESDAATWEPSPDVPRWQPPAGAKAGVRVETEDTERRPPPPRVSPLALPFVWWSRHPWIVVWVAVFLTPAGVLLLRAVDEAGFEHVVEPLQWTLVALLAVIVVRGMHFSLQHSLLRLALGLVAAVGAAGVLLYPVTRIDLGRVICPPRAGTDLGVRSAAAAIAAWQRGDKGEAVWHNGEPDPAWAGKASAISLLDYQLVDSGCFERVAPIDVHRTWHDFRVTIREGERAPLSKVVVVRTAAEGGAWKITSIEGPLP
jgi:hypothetical protein